MDVTVINENTVEVNIGAQAPVVVEVDQGKAGRGIVSVTYEPDGAVYYLEITYTDGTTELVGPIPVDEPATLVNYYIKASAAITKGDLVMFTGAVGASGTLQGAPASAGLSEGLVVMGIASETMALNGFGYVTAFGLVSGINTTGSAVGETWATGDILYYNPAYVGKLTKVRPTSPAEVVVVAAVTNASAGNGSLFVRVSFYPKLTELSDVYAVSPANNDLLQWSSANSRWQKTSDLTLSGFLSVDSTTDSTSTTTGSIQTDGGIGVVKSVYVGGKVTIDSTTDSSSTTTGSLQTDGGAGIVKNLYVGGNALIGTATNTNSSSIVANGTISETVGGTQYLVASQYDIGTAPNEIPLNQYLGNLAYQDAGSIAGPVVIGANSSSDALRITQTGTGNALVVEDSANPDSTPFMVDASGNVGVGLTPTVKFDVSGGVAQFTGGDLIAYRPQTGGTGGQLQVTFNTEDTAGPSLFFNKSRGTSTSRVIVNSGDALATLLFRGYDGAGNIQAALISAVVDGTPGTNDMPGRLVFSTTADGASSPTERMRIDSAGKFALGSNSYSYTKFELGGTYLTDATWSIGYGAFGSFPSATTAIGYHTFLSTVDGSTVPSIFHYSTNQSTISGGTRTTPTNQYAFHANSSLTGATNNYGFFSNIASGTGRWNFYASGSADNYFAGNVGIGTTSPTSKLQVANSTAVDTYIRTSNSVATSGFDFGLSSGGDGYVYNRNNTNLIFGTNSAERLRISSTGAVSIAGDTLIVATAKTPASASDTGTTGQIAWDSNYVYVCVATNTWKRSALSTW